MFYQQRNVEIMDWAWNVESRVKYFIGHNSIELLQLGETRS